MTCALSYDDLVRRLAREIYWMSYYPERISAEAREIARDIRRLADELGRKENLHRTLSRKQDRVHSPDGAYDETTSASAENVVVFPGSKR
jgi:uncharacterized alpha-E superfamily protein